MKSYYCLFNNKIKLISNCKKRCHYFIIFYEYYLTKKYAMLTFFYILSYVPIARNSTKCLLN